MDSYLNFAGRGWIKKHVTTKKGTPAMEIAVVGDVVYCGVPVTLAAVVASLPDGAEVEFRTTVSKFEGKMKPGELVAIKPASSAAKAA